MLQLVNTGIKTTHNKEESEKGTQKMVREAKISLTSLPIPTVLNVFPFFNLRKKLEYCLGSTKSLAN